MKKLLTIALIVLCASSAFSMGALKNWVLEPSHQYIIYSGARYNFAEGNHGLTANIGVRTPFPGVPSNKLCLLHNLESGGGYGNLTEQAAMLFTVPTEVLPKFLRARSVYVGPLLGAGVDVTNIPEDATWYLLYSAGGIIAFDLSDYWGITGYYAYKRAFTNSEYDNGNSAGIAIYMRLPNM